MRLTQAQKPHIRDKPNREMRGIVLFFFSSRRRDTIWNCDWSSDVCSSDLFTEATGRPVGVVNDADAAGLAEVRFGAGKGQAGVVLVVTLGTGIGSALFTNGELVRNTEFGH